jgi:regulatory protein
MGAETPGVAGGPPSAGPEGPNSGSSRDSGFFAELLDEAERSAKSGPAQRSGRPSRGRSREDGAEQDPRQLARDVVYRLLAVRARSVHELLEALREKEVDAELARETVQKFVDAGLVDDAAFAQEWVRARHEQRGLGRKALGFELRRKGVAEEFIQHALDEVDSESEEDRARELVRRKVRGGGKGDRAARTRRLVGMLARKGYSEGLAYRVVRDELDHEDTGDPLAVDDLAEEQLGQELP